MFNRPKALLIMVMMAVVACFGLAGNAQAVTYDLKVSTGSVTMPDGTSVPIWGYSDCGMPADCATAPPASIPGPVLEVPAGDSLTINIHNTLPEATSLIVPGLPNTPLAIGGNSAKPSYTTEAAALTGVTSYTFTTPRPGTYLYESGTNASKQVQMGLYGALIVRPAGYIAASNKIAYAGTTAYDREEVLVLSDIDPDWHNAVYAGGAHNGSYNAVYYNPKYWLINGKAYPDTDDVLVRSDENVLLRYVNTASQDHTILIQGVTQTTLAKDAFPVSYPRETHSTLLSPGQTRDMTITPATAGLFPLFDRQMDITNADRFPGGMVSMVRVIDSALGGLQIASNPVAQGSEGQSYAYDMVAFLADNPDAALVYSLVIPDAAMLAAGYHVPPAGMTINAATGKISWDVPASYTGGSPLKLMVRVEVAADPLTFLTQDVLIAVNRNPVIASVAKDAGTPTETPITFGGSVDAVGGAAFSATVSASDPDLGDVLSYYLIEPPTGMSIDGSGVISWAHVTNSPDGHDYDLGIQLQVRDDKGGVALFPFSLHVLTTATAPPPGDPVVPTYPVTVLVEEVSNDPLTGLPLPPVAVNNFKFLITEDNTPVVIDPATSICLDANGNGPGDDCPSDKPFQSNALPIMDGSTVGGVGNTVQLPIGRYFVSVLTNDGVSTGQDSINGGLNKMDGRAFEVTASGATVTVPVIAGPTPLSRISVQVFEDIRPLNGTWDRLNENVPTRGKQYDPVTGALIPGSGTIDHFTIVLNDLAGSITQDYYGNPICSEYDALGNVIPGTGGVCLTDDNGFISIENLPPGKIEVLALPPVGSGWVQTTTIEGSKVIDAFVMEGNQGVFPIETAALIFHGFVQECPFGTCNAPVAPGAGTFHGQVHKVSPARPPFNVMDGIAEAVVRPRIALNNLSGNGEQVALVRGDANGNFQINGVPDGMYQLVVFDDGLDYIMATYTVVMPEILPSGVENRNIEVFDPRFGTGPERALMIPDWWGQLKGSVFLDTNENGFRDPGEEGLSGEAVESRFRDGSLYAATATNEAGDYHLRRYFPFGHWTIPAVGYGRMAATGASIVAAEHLTQLGEPPLEVRTDVGPVLTMGTFLVEGGVNRIDWGKKPYPTVGNAAAGNDYVAINGGVSGVVWYGTTRNAFDIRYAGADDWEPGIPNITVQLYEAVLDPITGNLVTVPTEIESPAGSGIMIPNPDPHAGTAVEGRLIGEVQTDHFNASPPADCSVVVKNLDGTVTTTVDPACREVLATWNQVKPAVFDGGYQFFEDCRDDSKTDPSQPDFDPNALYPSDSGLCAPIAPGKYLVRVVVPPPYKLVTANDVNTIDQGDTFGANPYAAPTQPLLAPSGCVGPVYEVTQVIDPPNPDFGKQVNDCSLKVVTLSDGNNGAADFHLFTEVPIPARLRGFVNDNLNLEAGLKPQFGDKAGVSGVPVSLQDYKGNEMARAYTDKNGFFEVLLPSTNRVNAPTPTGMAPNMVAVYANHPGMTATLDPAFNPNYDTLRMQFELYPGKTSYADMAMTPVNGFFAGKNITCLKDDPLLPATRTPQIAGVDDPLATSGFLTVQGTGFGLDQGPNGKVTLDGTPLLVTAWSENSITVQIINADGITPIPYGPHQLLVTGDNLKVSTLGLTIHLIDPTGVGYSPNVEVVGGNGLYPGETIQAAIDRSPAGSLLLVPGNVGAPIRYQANPIVYKGISLQGYGPGATQFVDGLLNPTLQDAWSLSLNNIVNVLREADLSLTQPILGSMAAMTILGRDLAINPLPVGYPVDPDPGVRIDGIQVEGGRIGGGIHINTFADGTIISNTRVVNNFGVNTGGIALGFPLVTDNQIDGAQLHHNWLEHNGTLGSAGGLGIYNGVSNYRVHDNMICANGANGGGGGISHVATAGGVNTIDHNEVLFNWSFKDGGGILLMGPAPLVIGQASAGTGDVNIVANKMQGNYATEDGSAISIAQAGNARIEVVNNMIVNNVAAAQGAIRVQDSFDTVFVHNTVAKNVATSTSGSLVLDAGHHSAGMVVYRNTNPFQVAGMPVHSDPALYNNVFWDNTSYLWNEGTEVFEQPQAFDLDLYVTPGTLSRATNNLFSDQSLVAAIPVAGPPSNQIGTAPNWPLFVLPYDNVVTGVAVRAAGEIAINPLAVPVTANFTPLSPEGDYHVMDGSPALQYGISDLVAEGIALPTDDIDGDARPLQYCYDAGADETMGLSAQNTCDAALAAYNGFNILGSEGTPILVPLPEIGSGTFLWNYGDGTASVNGTGPVVFDHTYANSGPYTASLVVVIAGVAQQVTFSVDVANLPPLADAGLDLTVEVGQSAVLNGVASDISPLDNGALTYHWSYGDTTADATAGPDANHTYIAPGSYTATLTVTDPDGGVASDFAIVTVTPTAPGTVPGDLNGDGVVDAADYMILVNANGFCTPDPGFDPEADLNADGCVTLADFEAWKASLVDD